MADCASLAGQVAARTLVHQRAPLHLDQEDGPTVRKTQPCREDGERGIDSLLANVADEFLQPVHLPTSQVAHGPVVGHAEHERATARVGERSELVGDPFRAGRGDAAIVEVRLLELEAAVFAQVDPLLDGFGSRVVRVGCGGH